MEERNIVGKIEPGDYFGYNEKPQNKPFSQYPDEEKVVSEPEVADPYDNYDNPVKYPNKGDDDMGDEETADDDYNGN